MKSDRLKQERVHTDIPMIMVVRRNVIMQLINEELARLNQPQIPMDSEVSVPIAGHDDLVIDDNSQGINFRWIVR